MTNQEYSECFDIIFTGTFKKVNAVINNTDYSDEIKILKLDELNKCEQILRDILYSHFMKEKND